MAVLFKVIRIFNFLQQSTNKFFLMKKKWYFSSNIFIVSDKVITVSQECMILWLSKAINDTYYCTIINFQLNELSIKDKSTYEIKNME